MEYTLFKKLSRQKLGRYTEHLVCAKLLAFSLDVYLPTIDDHGVDVIVRKKDGRHVDIQVKAKRALKGPITFSSTFVPSETLFVVLAPFATGETEPTLYLVPSLLWLDPPAYSVFKKSTQRAGYQFDFNKGYQKILEPYAFDRAVRTYLVEVPAPSLSPEQPPVLAGR